MWAGQRVFQGTPIQTPLFQHAQAPRWHWHLFSPVPVPPEFPALLGHQEITFIAKRDVVEPSKGMIGGSWNCRCGMFN